MSSSNRKKERRDLRHNRNIMKEIKHKEEAWNNGKLIEENHNDGPYTEQYTFELCNRLIQRLRENRIKALESDNPGETFLISFRQYKMKIQDLILHWNDNVLKLGEYSYLKNLLETYWDDVIPFGNSNALLGVQ